MRELSASTPVAAPAGFSIAFLDEYIRDNAAPGGAAVLTLRYPLQRFAGGLVLEREVAVEVGYEPAAGDEPASLAIAWRPEGTTLFPTFAGRVDAAEAGQQRCTLTISGTYDVPLGVAGALFDAVVGVRIAEGTLHGLLAELRGQIETDYRRRIDQR